MLVRNAREKDADRFSQTPRMTDRGIECPRRALEASPYIERDRSIRDGAAAPARDERRGLTHEGLLMAYKLLDGALATA